MKSTIAKVTIEGTSYRIVRDPDTESGAVHFWVEKTELDKIDTVRWVELHSTAIKTSDTERQNSPSGIPARVHAALWERLSGNR